MSQSLPIIEIDGQRVSYDGFYDEPQFGGAVGAIYGLDENTSAEMEVRNIVPRACVWCLAIYRHNPDGSTWGIDALFRRGEWAKDENGRPLLRVWERIV